MWAMDQDPQVSFARRLAAMDQLSAALSRSIAPSVKAYFHELSTGDDAMPQSIAAGFAMGYQNLVFQLAMTSLKNGEGNGNNA